ncbi:MAG TPA: GNAT family N-acetyltransferase [Pirellulales bacterium]|jgi:CelD/BcsL family acetyltransferase involved in cellulose biosynthesis|nr:GNAT family N-acetyltransferase [Pirellulales bacterium]
MTSALSDKAVPGPSTAHPLRWLRATSLDALDALEETWRGSDLEIETPIGRFSWTKCCLAEFSDHGDPHLIAAVRGEKLVAVAPLVKKSRRGVARLVLCGTEVLFEPVDLIAVDDRARRGLVKRLIRSGAPLDLERVWAGSKSIHALVRACRGRAIVVERPQAPCSYITLADSWCEPDQHLESGCRGELHLARRKADELGGVAIEIHGPDLDELPELLDLAFEVEARSGNGETGAALLHDADRAAFYRRYAEAACVEGTLRICFLRIGDRVAAMQIALEDQRAFWLLKLGHDPRFASCSPGMLLMRETIRYAAEAGLERYEFLGRGRDWTRPWTDTEHETLSLCVYPFGLRGVAALLVDGAAALYRKWRPG